MWCEPRFDNLREHLKQPHVAQRKVTGDDKLQSVQLPAAKRHATIFNGSVDDIPSSVAKEVPRAIIVPCEEYFELTAAVMHHLDSSPMMLFGTETDVDAVVEQLHDRKVDKMMQAIRVYTRPSHHLPNAQRRLREKKIVIVSDPGATIMQVNPLPSPSPSPGQSHAHMQHACSSMGCRTCVVKIPVLVG